MKYSFLFMGLILTQLNAASSTLDSNMSSGVNEIIESENYAVPTQHEKTSIDKDNTKQGIYQYSYTPDSRGDGLSKNKSDENPFIKGNFEKIFRFEAISFAGSDEMEDEGEETFSKILDKLKEISKNEENEYLVSVISHTRELDKAEDDVELDSAYTNFFQSIAQYDRPSNEDVAEDNDDFDVAKYIYDRLASEDIPSKYIYTEKIYGSNPLYSESDEDARQMNERVEVAIYLKKFIDPDTDKDGVTDSNDFCPETALGARVDVNGCPYVLTLNLKFSFDNDTFEDTRSLEDVLKLGKFMKKYPVYRAVIIGHTDSVGRASYNKKLSKRRAALVVETLMSHGISSLRLSSDGRGESEPVSSNKTKEGRLENRRTDVELLLPRKKKSQSLKPRQRGREY